MHWHELPVAIPADAQNYAFSGSAVVDYRNTSGFGRPGNPAMVAIYTATDRVTNMQRQAVAYSLDNGRTFTKYGIVLDIGSTNFRDPKVFWYAPGHEWLMTAVLSDQHKVTFYTSPDLKHWTHLSDFGPGGRHRRRVGVPRPVPAARPVAPGQAEVGPGGQPQPRRHRRRLRRPVLRRRPSTARPSPLTTSRTSPPSGTLIGDGGFEGADYGNWTPAGAAFGSGPAHADNPTNGAIGHGWVDSLRLGRLRHRDADVTHLHDQPQLHQLPDGRRKPPLPCPAGLDQLRRPAPTIEDFEGATCVARLDRHRRLRRRSRPSKETLSGQVGKRRSGHLPGRLRRRQGTITSPAFTIDHRYLDVLVGGGNHPLDGAMPTAVAVLVERQRGRQRHRQQQLRR